MYSSKDDLPPPNQEVYGFKDLGSMSYVYKWDGQFWYLKVDNYWIKQPGSPTYWSNSPHATAIPATRVHSH